MLTVSEFEQAGSMKKQTKSIEIQMFFKLFPPLTNYYKQIRGKMNYFFEHIDAQTELLYLKNWNAEIKEALETISDESVGDTS